MHPPRSAPFFLTSVALPLVFLVGLLSGGCATWYRDNIIHESVLGSVSLEHLPERGSTAMYRPPTRSIQTSHPVRLDSAVLAQALRGIHVRLGASQSSTPSSKPRRAFSDTDIEFLSPHLSTALARATAEQRVRFHVVRVAAAGGGIVGGTLYVEGPYLHLSLTDFGRIELEQQEVVFLPESLRHPEVETRNRGLFGSAYGAALAIDYSQLPTLPVLPDPASKPTTQARPQPAANATPPAPSPLLQSPQPPPAQEPASSSDDLRALKEHVVKKDMESQSMKEELRALRRKLADQEAELNKLKKQNGKKAPPAKQP